MKLEEIYNPIKKELIQLESMLENLNRTVDKSNPEIKKIVRYFFNSKGKYLRPALVLFSYKSVNKTSKTDIKQVIELAMAVELIHSASLIHDDIIDNSEYRRTQLSLNKKFGNKIAVLMGDLLYTYALSNVTKNFNKEILNILLECVTNMCMGEITNLATSIIKFEEYLSIIKDKTARFMSACCKIGAIAGSGTEDEIKSLEEFGLNFGIAYQLIDDYMDQDTPIKIDNVGQAKNYILKAKQNISVLKNSEYKESLQNLAEYILKRSNEKNCIVTKTFANI